MDRMQIENYFKNLYTIYEQKSFQEFVETCLSYMYELEIIIKI